MGFGPSRSCSCCSRYLGSKGTDPNEFAPQVHACGAFVIGGGHMASASVTARGILVVFDPSVVCGRDGQDDAAIECELGRAVSALGITIAQLDVVTSADSWCEQLNRGTGEVELHQEFRWQPSVTETNWLDLAKRSA